MTRYITNFIIVLVLCSCKDINGRIEKRDNRCDGIAISKRIFLVNNSKTQKYQYTVKSTESINDSINNYSTEQIILEPGDEKDLGCDLYYYEIKYLTSEKLQIVDSGTEKIYQYKNKTYSRNDLKKFATESKMNVDDYINEVPNLKIVPLFDTTINGNVLKYKKVFWIDSSKIISQKKHFFTSK
jgi:hypothetical protein